MKTASEMKRIMVLTAAAAAALLARSAELPADYSPLEYVRFAGGAYVDTGTPVASVQITMKVNADLGPYFFFGSDWQNYKSLYFGQYQNDSGTWLWRTASQVSRVDEGAATAGLHDIVYGKLDDEWGGAYIDGARNGVNSKAASTGDYNLLVGKYYGGGNLVGDVYSFAVTNRADGSAVMDLVPCWRVSDRRYGFFDRMRGIFLSHENLGIFPKPGLMLIVR